MQKLIGHWSQSSMLAASHLDLRPVKRTRLQAKCLSDGVKLVRSGEWHARSEAPGLQRDDE